MPVWVGVWLVVHGAGLFVPLVAAVMAVATAGLYRLAAGSLSRTGGVIVLAAVVATLALSFPATVVFDQLRAFAAGWDVAWWPALTSQEFGYFVLHRALLNAPLWSRYVPMMALAAMLAALASFGALRLFRDAKER